MTENCIICFEPLVEDTVVTYCDHRFHKPCIVRWKDTCHKNGQLSSCPTCRNEKIIIDRDIPLKECRQKYMDLKIEFRITKRSYETRIEDYEEQIEEYDEDREKYEEQIQEYESTIQQLLSRISQLEQANELLNKSQTQ